MTSYALPNPQPSGAQRASAPSRALAFSVPAKHNPRLQALVERIDADDELRQLWRSANVNAGERCGLGDHGETHARIVANAGLLLLRILLEAGQRSGVVEAHGLSRADAEVVVVLAAALHDVGLAVSVNQPGVAGLGLAQTRAEQILSEVYSPVERTALIGEILHAINAHHEGPGALTLEAAVLTIADVLDMSKGRLATEGGACDSVDAVHILRGARRPVRVEFKLTRAASLSAVVDRLTTRLAHVPLAAALEFAAQTPTGDVAVFHLDRQHSQ